MENLAEKRTVQVMKPRWSDSDIETIIKRQHSWFSGLLPPRSFKILETCDIYVPYILTGVCYYKSQKRRFRCYVFENMDLNIKSGVVGIENLEFVEEDACEDARVIDVDREKHASEIAHYCNLRLLARHYRKFINWTIDILEVRVMYRKKRIINYEVNGKLKKKDIFLDSMVLK